MEYSQKRTMPLFGISGVDESFYGTKGCKHTFQVPQWLQGIGLNAFEYSFGRGINIGEETASKVGAQVTEYGTAMSAHAPYFVSYASSDPQKVENSHKYLLDSCRTIGLMGGKRVIVHCGVQNKEHSSREQSVTQIAENLQVLAQKMDQDGFLDTIMCLETMGRYTQIGDYKEIAQFCTIDKRFIPCFDFGHINCTMQGSLQKAEQYQEIFEHCIAVMGRDKVQNCHIHFSKIQFGAAGEIKHIDFDDTVFGPNFEPLAQTLKKMKLTPTIVCESSTTRAKDALYMQACYGAL
ncbi:MAG: TIM barrel protein [Firmicutes bacterium]|nr:TIM barrel protein [Bacillota bacterium]